MLWGELACPTAIHARGSDKSESRTAHAKSKAIGGWGMGRRTDYPSGVLAVSAPFA